MAVCACASVCRQDFPFMHGIPFYMDFGIQNGFRSENERAKIVEKKMSIWKENKVIDTNTHTHMDGEERNGHWTCERIHDDSRLIYELECLS